MREIDVVIIGGGPAGLAAAIKLYERGIKDIIILEREFSLGGILRQCIHDGFGLKRFGESLSGPEYSERFINKVKELGIEYLVNTTVTDISEGKQVTAVCKDGLLKFKAKAIVLAMGCKERTRGMLAIPGERPTGVFTAGCAQAYINLYNRMPAKEVVILGSGDIGLIMARRLTLEGAHVKAVYELMPTPNGLPRNIIQCLEDYDIPLYLSHTVTQIHGASRVEAITVSKVDDKLKPIPGTEERIECDTLILSVGLIPEIAISEAVGATIDSHTKGTLVDEHLQTSIPGIFSAGNVLHVHDLVDFVTIESESMADSVYEYLSEGNLISCANSVNAGFGIGHTIPQKVSGTKDIQMMLRVNKTFKNAEINVMQNDTCIVKKKLSKAIPAEMIELTIPADKMSESGDLEVRVVC